MVDVFWRKEDSVGSKLDDVGSKSEERDYPGGERVLHREALGSGASSTSAAASASARPDLSLSSYLSLSSDLSLSSQLFPSVHCRCVCWYAHLGLEGTSESMDHPYPSKSSPRIFTTEVCFVVVHWPKKHECFFLLRSIKIRSA